MNDKRLKSVQLLENIFVFIVIYTLMILPLAVFSDNIQTTVYKAFVLVLIIFAQNFIRDHVESFFIFLILHISLIGLCFFFSSGMVEKIGYVFFGVLSSIVSYKLHFSSQKVAYQISFLIFSELIITVCYILSVYFNIGLLSDVLYVLSIIFFISFMLYYHGTNMAVSLNNIANVKSQPIKQILSFNNKVIGIFLIFMLIFLLCAPFLHIGDFINLLGALIITFLRFLFSHLDTSEPQAPSVEQSTPMPDAQSPGFIIEDAKEPSIILQVIEKIFMYGVSVAAIIGILFLVGFGIYTFYKRFYTATKKSEVDETKEFIGLIDIFNENPLTTLIKRITPNGIASTNEQKVRRIFYKRVKKQIARGEKIEISETALEITKKISSDETLSELTPLYEKARYSNIPCTKDDINFANQILNKK